MTPPARCEIGFPGQVIRAVASLRMPAFAETQQANGERRWSGALATPRVTVRINFTAQRLDLCTLLNTFSLMISYRASRINRCIATAYRRRRSPQKASPRGCS